MDGGGAPVTGERPRDSVIARQFALSRGPTGSRDSVVPGGPEETPGGGGGDVVGTGEDGGEEKALAGDGDDAWIEVELAEVTRIMSVGFWTRTMGDSAQVRSFQVTTDDGEVHGPFAVDDATTIYYFDANLEAKRLRFEVLETSGGNTGALEIEVYGEAVE